MVIVAAATKKRAVLSKKVDAAGTPLSKRPRREDEPVGEAPRPQKRIKKLAQKGEREVHMINSQTTEATASDDLPAASVTQGRPTPISQPPQATPDSEAAEPAVASTIPEVVKLFVAAPVVEPTTTAPPVAPVLDVTPALVAR